MYDMYYGETTKNRLQFIQHIHPDGYAPFVLSNKQIMQKAGVYVRTLE